jgi:hypothetical protein
VLIAPPWSCIRDDANNLNRRIAPRGTLRGHSLIVALTAALLGRVVGPADIAALAVHLMTNTAITGATFDIDGGQQLVGG